MDRRLKRLVESIMHDYQMNVLNENIFKKLNAQYKDAPDLGRTKVARDANEGLIRPLIAASDRLDIRNYFIDSLKLNNILSDIVTMTIKYINGRKGNIPYDTDRSGDKYSFPDLTGLIANELEARYKSDKIINISSTYAGKTIVINTKLSGINHYIKINVVPVDSRHLLPDMGVYTGCLRFETESRRLTLGNLICNWSPDRNSSSVNKPAIAKAIAEFNASQALLSSRLDDFINLLVDETYNVDRIEEELFCTERVYKVVEKDIKRLANIFNLRGTAQLGGFDKITTPEKMVARLAATFICADYMNIHDVELRVDDDIVIKLFTNESYIGSNDFDCLNLLSRCRNRMKDGKHIHLKDVIATYLAYKDDPTIQSYCRKHC